MARVNGRRVNGLVIAVDYGTTFTGCAYRALTFERDGSIKNEKLHHLSRWPGPKLIEESKAPSAISFATALAREHQWGFDISPDSATLILTKLQLEQQDRITELESVLNALKALSRVRINGINQNDGLARAYSKEPEQIMAEYLRGVRRWLVEQLPRDYKPAWLLTIPIDLVVTLPSGWSEGAKDRTLRAFREAGFDKSTPEFSNLRDVITISEPEAAALYTVRSISESQGDNAFCVNECFVLCDAGGGTVDLISYRITQIQPTLEISQIGLPTGSRCGSSFIDESFRVWLQGRLGVTRYQELQPKTPESAIGLHTALSYDMRNIMNEFINLKKAFAGNTSQVAILEHADDVSISGKDIQEMFDPLVDEILELLNDQLIQARDEGANVRYIFLCGGFAESQYLAQKVNDFARLRGTILMKPDEPWLAVVRGAVARGFQMGAEDSALRSKIRRHYGVSTSQPFSAVRHSVEDAYIDLFDGERKASHQMSWLIKKGDTLHTTQPKIGSVVICRRFGIEDPRVFETTIVACDDDEVPQRQHDIHTGRSTSFTITYDLRQVPPSQLRAFRAGANGQPYFSAELTIVLKLQERLNVSVVMNGRVISSDNHAYI